MRCGLITMYVFGMGWYQLAHRESVLVQGTPNNKTLLEAFSAT